MSTAARHLDDRASEARAFFAGFRTLQLATVSADGEPEASYAPFVVRGDGAMCIYVSDLSRHTANLRVTGRASVLFVASEADTEEMFARVRLTFRCAVRPHERHSDAFEQILDQFDAEFGEVMKMIRPLEDFHLFALVPESGSYVRGFAQAYRFVGAELAEFGHVRDKGHRGSSPAAS